MVKLTGSPNYKMTEISRLLTVVEDLLPLGRDEWERVAVAYNTNRSRSWAERDLDSLRRKFKALYSARKPTGTAEMPPHILKAKMTKQAIDDKANVVEMDDVADQDDSSGREQARVCMTPDFSFEPGFEEPEGEGDAPPGGTDAASTSYVRTGDSFPEGTSDAEVTEALFAHCNQLQAGGCELQLGAEGLEAFGPIVQSTPPPSAGATRLLRSLSGKKPKKSSDTHPVVAQAANISPTTKTGKTPAARGFLPGSPDEQEAHRHMTLSSTSNRLGGTNLYAFRDGLGAKRAREGDDNEQAEASFAKIKRMRALKATSTLKQKLADLESSSKNIGNSTFEMMMLLREEGERKAENRRVEEERHRRDEAAAKEARLHAEKLEAEERRRQDKMEAEERARRDKEDARARTQEMIMLIGAIFKKE